MDRTGVTKKEGCDGEQTRDEEEGNGDEMSESASHGRCDVPADSCEERNKGSEQRNEFAKTE